MALATLPPSLRTEQENITLATRNGIELFILVLATKKSQAALSGKIDDDLATVFYLSIGAITPPFIITIVILSRNQYTIVELFISVLGVYISGISVQAMKLLRVEFCDLEQAKKWG
eukprot:Awhi_evm2s8675